MDKFIKCEKNQAHVYDSKLKECPYCNGKTIEIDLENLPETEPGRKKIDLPIADCYMIGQDY